MILIDVCYGILGDNGVLGLIFCKVRLRVKSLILVIYFDGIF